MPGRWLVRAALPVRRRWGPCRLAACHVAL